MCFSFLALFFFFFFMMRSVNKSDPKNTDAIAQKKKNWSSGDMSRWGDIYHRFHRWSAIIYRHRFQKRRPRPLGCREWALRRRHRRQKRDPPSRRIIVRYEWLIPPLVSMLMLLLLMLQIMPLQTWQLTLPVRLIGIMALTRSTRITWVNTTSILTAVVAEKLQLVSFFLLFLQVIIDITVDSLMVWAAAAVASSARSLIFQSWREKFSSIADWAQFCCRLI